MCEQKFFRCRHCGNFMGLVHNSGVPVICCGEPMEELVANTAEASTEKHLPEVSMRERLVHVKIGSVAHPMTQEHHIEFIYLQTEHGGQRKCLEVGAEAAAMFAVLDDAPVAVYAYCNLHGLWKTEISACCDHAAAEEAVDGEIHETVCSPEFPEGCR